METPTPPTASGETTAELRERIEALEQHNAELEEQIRLLKAMLYGRSSEKKPAAPTPEQPDLPFDEDKGAAVAAQATTEATVDVQGHTRQKPGRRPIIEDLPRVEVLEDLPENEKVCPCGCALTRIGEEVSERLDIVPAKIQVIRTIRPKYACRGCEGTEGAGGAVKIAPVPPQIIPQGIVTPGLLAHVVTSKFVDGVPLYRQEQQFIRLGLEIPHSTLASWVNQVADACEPLFQLLVGEVLSGPVINMDETRVQVMREPGRPNTAMSYMWVCRGGVPDRPGLIFRYEPSRAGRVAEEILRGYRGYLQTDGYSGYEAIGDREGIIHLGCWAHARRKFVDVVKGTKGQAKAGVAQEIIDLIARLYAVESAAQHQELTPEALVAKRAVESRPVLDQIKALLDARSRTTPPKSLLGKAITYSLNQWPRLTVYLQDGCLRPDNNLAENAVRPFAIGRKNWLFSGSPHGATCSATLYSLIETAKANNLEPYAYLRLLFT
ncbi:MAG: IS66 family transposase, partial [Candidatus Riflebacteria bacterium]|nr:IS66 family transposase [Candidatus Riflebacteria bacterium]